MNFYLLYQDHTETIIFEQFKKEKLPPLFRKIYFGYGTHNLVVIWSKFIKFS